MIKKIALTIALFIAVVGIMSSQNASMLPSIGIGTGVLSFDGDIGVGLNLTSLSRVRGAYLIKTEKRFGSIIGVAAKGVYGKLADGERGANRNLNFESKIFEGDLNLVLHLDNDYLLKRNSTFAPFLVVGVGFLKFNSYGDLKNKDGVDYNYWADGTIRSLPDSAIGSKILRRDYTYETQLNSDHKYSNTAITLPVGVGVGIKIIERFYINLAATYYFTSTDWIDNFKEGKNDRFFFANMTLQYNFGKAFDDSNPIYKTVDFVSLDSLDSDGDGVYDANDHCPGTPIGVTITPDGCPEDNDGDGIPDYMDKDPLTIVGRDVTETGETLTEKMIAERLRRFNSEATERSQLFNENPSFKYLKKLEAKSRSVRKNTSGESYSLPVAMLPFDLDDDDYLSAEELVKAIDSFFDGDSEVESLNGVIDFFFEQ